MEFPSAEMEPKLSQMKSNGLNKFSFICELAFESEYNSGSGMSWLGRLVKRKTQITANKFERDSSESSASRFASVEVDMRWLL